MDGVDFVFTCQKKKKKKKQKMEEEGRTHIQLMPEEMALSEQKQLWQKNFGQVYRTYRDFYEQRYYFCIWTEKE